MQLNTESILLFHKKSELNTNILHIDFVYLDKEVNQVHSGFENHNHGSIRGMIDRIAKVSTEEDVPI